MALKAITTGTHKFTSPNGITFNYAVSGSGPLVVFQSIGWGLSMQLYKNTFQPLESAVTLLHFEPRGSGGSSQPSSPDAMSTKEMASDLEHLRQHLGVEQMNLMGHSNGGAIALTYAEEYPDNVEKLVLIDHELQGFSSDNFMKYAQARKDHPVYGPALQTMIQRKQVPPTTEQEFSDFLEKVSPYFFTDTTKSHLMGEALKDGSLSVFNFQNQSRCDEQLKFNAVEGLGNVTAKTLVINGDDDAMCSLAAAKKAAEGIPTARLEIVKDAGHMPWLEKPDDFFPLLREFLLE